MSVKTIKFKTSKNNCCVVGCGNTYNNSPEMIFYSFPSEKFPGRKEKWIAAIRRTGVDGKPWIPTKHSKVCSSHFVNGRKSDHPLHPAYNPTLMPSPYKQRKATDLQQNRHDRLMKRTTNQPKAFSGRMLESSNECTGQSSLNSTRDCSVQTDFCVAYSDNSFIGVLFCASNGNNVSIQTDIPSPKLATESGKKSVFVKPTNHVKCGPDHMNHGFNGYESIKDDDEIRGLCGVSLEMFAFLILNLKNVNSKKITIKNRLLLFLVKLKLGLTFAALGVLFGIHRTSASKHFFVVLEELTLRCGNMIYWPSKFAVRSLLPSAFQNFENVRCIIDCTELMCERPPGTAEQVLLYSNYKGHFTVKFLLGITPNGFISFISKGYGGRSTDAYITANSGFLDLLEPGDTVMADKGFPLIKHELEKKCIKLIMPPFATNPQFSKAQADETYNIASVRIHVERCIARVKMYRVLDKITIDMLPYIDAIMRMCCVLVNLQKPIIKQE